MTIGLHPVELRMIGAADGLDIDLDALQGLWSVQQYLKLSDQTNHLLEFTDGAMSCFQCLLVVIKSFCFFL